MSSPARAWAVATVLLLSACATVPPGKYAHKTPHPEQRVFSNGPGSVVSNHEAAFVATPLPAASAPNTVWDRLRDSFSMPDCNADPAVVKWAKRYTHNHRRFESQMQTVLPRLVYVQKVAAEHGVAGEFALMPWVESHFEPAYGRHHRAVGMWQIIPMTAGSMGLRVDGHYDGRMDVPAATEAVMTLLRKYHDQFHDWRVTDYAYNGGKYSVVKMMQKYGSPADMPVIPSWRVPRVTREHLEKMLAIACVVREPQRFNVTLPTLPKDEHLVKVNIPHPMPIARAARHAGMSVKAVKHLNSAFRDNRIDDQLAPYLVLPADHAQQFRNALRSQANHIGKDGVASLVPVPTASEHETSARIHTVRSGESLWLIAHHYSVSVDALKRWNHLRSSTVKPGQKLKISDGG